jgi:hypothetical protein
MPRRGGGWEPLLDSDEFRDGFSMRTRRITLGCRRNCRFPVCVESICEAPQAALESRFMGYQAVPRGDPSQELTFIPYPIFGRFAEGVWMTPLPPKRKTGSRRPEKITLKTIAEHLGLTAGTVSAALNNSPAARSIPEHTKNRIIAAAHELNYRPNFFARTLRLKRTYTIGVIAEEIGDAYGAMVISASKNT